MRFVRLLAAMAALGFSAQASAFNKTSGAITTDASGVAVIPLGPLDYRGGLWWNQFRWSSDLPASISIQQDYDLTTNVQQHTIWWVKPHVVIPGSTTTVHYTPIDNFGIGTDVSGKFSATYWTYGNYTTEYSSNYMASLIAKAAPNTILTYNLRTGWVPEPGTWALMILGFGGIGAALRRKRSDGALVPASA